MKNFIETVQQQVLVKKKQQLILDFGKTIFFSGEGTLLLFAELDRVIQLSKFEKPLKCTAPDKRRSREVMKQIGFFELTGDHVDVEPQRQDVIYWRATKGANQDGKIYGPLIDYVAKDVSRLHANSIEAKGLWQGVSEAVNNTADHAYEGERGDGFDHADKTKWWMFTHVSADAFTVAVCDLGGVIN